MKWKINGGIPDNQVVAHLVFHHVVRHGHRQCVLLAAYEFDPGRQSGVHCGQHCGCGRLAFYGDHGRAATVDRFLDDAHCRNALECWLDKVVDCIVCLGRCMLASCCLVTDEAENACAPGMASPGGVTRPVLALFPDVGGPRFPRFLCVLGYFLFDGGQAGVTLHGL